MSPELIELFWSKVAISGSDDCWEWTAAKSEKGYGRFGPARRIGWSVYAHRVAWILTNGKISDGHEVCHRCNHHSCCNPAHLYQATHAGNMADMFRDGLHRTNPIRGPDHYRSKLSSEQVRRIRKDSRKQVVVAREFGVSQTQVSKIQLRHSRSEA